MSVLFGLSYIVADVEVLYVVRYHEQDVYKRQIYISREIHEKVAIVASRMENGLSIGKFVDNILRDHFWQYGTQYMEQIENAQKVKL